MPIEQTDLDPRGKALDVFCRKGRLHSHCRHIAQSTGSRHPRAGKSTAEGALVRGLVQLIYCSDAIARPRRRPLGMHLHERAVDRGAHALPGPVPVPDRHCDAGSLPRSSCAATSPRLACLGAQRTCACKNRRAEPVRKSQPSGTR